MNIACTIAPGRGDTDMVLAQVARLLAERGVRLCGTVQINTDCPDDGPCDMDVRVLPDGPSIRISQSLGKNARGCRLDPQALERAVALADKRLGDGAEVLIVNKFGKHEAEGRGFREPIARAIALGIPVLVGLNTLNQAAFAEFTGGAATALPPDATTLSDWVMTCLRPENGQDATAALMS